MTGQAISDTVRNPITQVTIARPRLDVMRVHVPATCSACLAGIVIACENRVPPKLILDTAQGLPPLVPRCPIFPVPVFRAALSHPGFPPGGSADGFCDLGSMGESQRPLFPPKHIPGDAGSPLHFRFRVRTTVLQSLSCCWGVLVIVAARTGLAAELALSRAQFTPALWAHAAHGALSAVARLGGELLATRGACFRKRLRFALLEAARVSHICILPYLPLAVKSMAGRN
mgnify:CR=1 FL=1